MWKTVKLGDVCDFQGGSQPPKKEFVYEEQKGYVRFIQIRDFKSDKNLTYIPVSNKNRLCRTDDIFIGRYGASVGQILRGLKGAYNVALMKTIPNEEFISKGWLFAYLNSSLFQKPLKEVSSRSAQNGFNKDDISSFELPLPPLAEQERIVAKLDAAFAEIDEAEKIASSAADSARQLFKKELSLIFLTSRSGWNNTTIVNCCQLKSGNTINKALEKTEGELPYLKVADMNLASNADGVITSSRFVLKADISDKAIIKKGSVIFPKRGGAIATNKKRLTLTDICADLNIMSVYPKASLIPELLYYFFKNIDMAMLGSGSSIPQINNYNIEPLSISYPIDKSEQLNLASRLKDLEYESERLAVTYQCKVAELVKLKSAILAQELKPSEAA